MQIRASVLGLLAACGGSSVPRTTPSPVKNTRPDAAPSAASPMSSRCGRTPRAIATDQDAPAHVVVDTTTVYWTNQGGGQVMSAPLDGSSAPHALVEKQHPFDIAVDATHVYWTNNLSRTGSVMRVPKQGNAPSVIADAQARPSGLAITAEALYWVNEENGTVVRAALDGQNRKVLATVPSNPQSIATDGRSVFWIHTKAGPHVQQVSIDGGTPVTLADPRGNPQNVVVHRSRVYWTNPARGTVEAIPIDGGTAADVVIDEHAPIEFVIDGRSIYLVDHDAPHVRPPPPQRIRRVPLAGGEAVTLASGSDAFGIAVDAECVYWTEARGGTGAVMTVAK